MIYLALDFIFFFFFCVQNIIIPGVVKNVRFVRETIWTQLVELETVRVWISSPVDKIARGRGRRAR